MRKRGTEVKGKKVKEKPHCKIYIFCEGKTEEIYLRHFENKTYNVEVIPVNTEHTDAYGIVSFAKDYINKEHLDLKLGDRGYCVFDSDPGSNPDIKKTFNLLNGCCHKGLYGIFSNPSFEIWFVLHFQNAPYGKNASQIKHLVKELVKEKKQDYSETTDIFNLLLPLQNDALKRARLLHKSQKEVHETVYSHECNPYTDIFRFIDYIEVLKK